MVKRKKARTVKAPTKRIKKEIKAIRRGLNKEMALAKKASKKASQQGEELELLKRDLEKLKKRKKRAVLSEYNRFMRAQIKRGLTFKQAAAAWQRKKKAEAKKFKRRSSYNVFVSMQLKQGKTMKQAIRAWNRLKNPPKRRRKKPAKKVKVRRRRKPAVKKLKRKIRRPKKRPVRKPRKKIRRPKRRVVKKPKKRIRRIVKIKRTIVRKPAVFPVERISAIVSDAIRQVQQKESVKTETISETISKVFSEGKPCNEELSLDLLGLYFSEVARFGLKRSLSLDEIVSAYFYSLARIQRSGIELKEIKQIVDKNI